MFRITHGQGFQLDFDNGVTVSVQFGGGNYCKNHDTDTGWRDIMESPDAEVAVMICLKHPLQTIWLTQECCPEASDIGIGGQTPSDVLRILAWAAQYVVDR